ncbi:unnamed protein product [Caenorhabditis auriculariae]|uniref:Acyl_transf_3 domain-containing protein n=1 Tax=Caenorhabditis auriculariae TaxID=2777116 RepID=A0A8S1HAG8_9PELO|nr:unnamed protein product [Caenorhabditis auriculariae]
MLSMQKIAKKRLDLQGLRGLAIISVVLFHFFPKKFPNGYVGVDLFFVLSGFFMAMLLTRILPKNVNFATSKSVLYSFYSKRIRRLVPSYLFSTCLMLLLVYSVFPESATDVNVQSAPFALFFVSNREKSDTQGYAEMLSLAVDVFTHTWSLSVEMQFYLIIPIIFLISSFFKDKQFTVIFIIGFFSAIIQLSTPKSKKCKNYHTLINIFFLILGSFSPLDINQHYLRLNITLMTGLLIAENPQNTRFLSIRLLTFFGDISYSLYLVHWPIFAYIKLILGLNNINLFCGIVLSIALATVITYTFERWSLQSSPRILFMTIVFLYIANIGLYQTMKVNENLQKESYINTLKHLDRKNLTLDQVIALNNWYENNDDDVMMIPECEYDTRGPFDWCRFKNLSKTASQTIMIMGNSWAANNGKLIYDECRDKARNMSLYSSYGCEPTYPTHNQERCKESFTTFVNNLKSIKPDILFIIYRPISLMEPFKTHIVTDDEIYKVAKDQLLKYRELVKKKIFLLDSIPRSDRYIVKMINKALRENIPIHQELLTDPVSVAGNIAARMRTAQLLQDCGPKCERIDLEPVFRDENGTGVFRMADDKGLVYFSASHHLSLHGFEVVRPVYRDICSKL